MARFNAEKSYQLIMECYQSGLSTRQWLIENDFCESTFYKWVKRLRSQYCYNIPPSGSIKPAIPYEQDVVQVNVIPDEPQTSMTVSSYEPLHPALKPQAQSVQPLGKAAITIQFGDASILINDNTDPGMLTAVLKSVMEALC